MTDFFVVRGRATQLAGLLSYLWLWCEEEGWPDDLEKDRLTTFLTGNEEHLWLWGEGAVPQFLPYVWFIRRVRPGVRAEGLLASIIRGLMPPDPAGEIQAQPSPYWTLEDVLRHQLAEFLGPDQDPMRRESANQHTYFVEPLLHLLAAANLKQTARAVWPSASRMNFSTFMPEERWQYCVVGNQAGRNTTSIPPLTKDWSDLQEEARSIACPEVPPTLLDRPFLLGLFTLTFPYRATPGVVRKLSHLFNRTWLLDPPIE